MINNVRKIRELKGLTLGDVADNLGVTKAQMSKMERGIIRLNDQWLDKLSVFYQCSVHDLIDDEFFTSNTKENHVAVAPLIGAIDAKEAGFIEHYEHQNNYSLCFSIPKKLKKYNKKEIFALDVRGGDIDRFKQGNQLAFVSIDTETQHLLKEGSVVVIKQKDHDGNDCGNFLRMIELDRYGFPYAVYKKKYRGSSVSTLDRTLLAGQIDALELISLYAQQDQGVAAKNKKNRDIPIINNELDIIGLLIKQVIDE